VGNTAMTGAWKGRKSIPGGGGRGNASKASWQRGWRRVVRGWGTLSDRVWLTHRWGAGAVKKRFDLEGGNIVFWGTYIW